MTTKIIFQKGEERIIANGEFTSKTGESFPGSPKGCMDSRMGNLTIEDNSRLRFAAIRVGAFTLDVVTEGKSVRVDELLKIDPSLQTEVKEVIYLGKERLK